jgi:hypothetical protein
MTISLNPTENLFDPAINKQNYSSISLSIQLSLKYLSFCIIDNSQNKFLAIVNYVFPEKVSSFVLADFINKLFEYESLLKKEYKNIIISYECTQSTLIPDEIYDNSNKEIYLSFFNQEIEDKIIISNFAPELKLYSIFAIPKCINNAFQNNLSNYKIIHSSNSYFQSIYNNFSNTENFNSKIFVDVESHSFEIVIFRNNKLLFNNSFQFKTKEDFLYYLLFVLNQLNINPVKIQLVLSGKITPNSSIFNLLTKYISNIIFIENQSNFTFSDVLSQIPPQQYFKLLNQIKCV